MNPIKSNQIPLNHHFPMVFSWFLGEPPFGIFRRTTHHSLPRDSFTSSTTVIFSWPNCDFTCGTAPRGARRGLAAGANTSAQGPNPYIYIYNIIPMYIRKVMYHYISYMIYHDIIRKLMYRGNDIFNYNVHISYNDGIYLYSYGMLVSIIQLSNYSNSITLQ